MIVVNQLSVSVAIIVQVAMMIALLIGKGNRIMHQILNSIAVLALLISVISIMNVPVRLYQVCVSPIFVQMKLPAGVVSVSYTFDIGGMGLNTAPNLPI